MIIPEFSLPSEIFIRQNIISSIPEIVKRFGKRIIILCTAADLQIFYDVALEINNSLSKIGISSMIYDNLPKTPNTEDIDEAVNFMKKVNCSMVIGLGGAESINAAKAASLLINNYVFCDNVFNGEPLVNDPIPLVVIPCLPVFGLEIAPLFYIQDVKQEEKRFFFDKRLYPKICIIDSTIPRMLSSSDIAKTGLATLAIALESVLSRAGNEIINTFAFKSIDTIFRNLLPACKGADNSEPMYFLSLSSFMSGIAFSGAYCSGTMAIALPLTLETNITLAEAMSILNPYVMEYNLTAAAGKYVQIARVMGEDIKNITVIEAAVKAVGAIRRLAAEVEVSQSLSAFNIQKHVFKRVAQAAMKYPFWQNMPRPIDNGEVEAILLAAFNA